MQVGPLFFIYPGLERRTVSLTVKGVVLKLVSKPVDAAGDVDWWLRDEMEADETRRRLHCGWESVERLPAGRSRAHVVYALIVY